MRGACRYRLTSLDLNAIDERGRTLLHRVSGGSGGGEAPAYFLRVCARLQLAETNCDPQHTADEMIDCLVNSGADLKRVDPERRCTPLHAAVLARRNCHVRKFIELGSPLSTADARGETPLILALKQNCFEIAKMLLCAGATFQSGRKFVCI